MRARQVVAAFAGATVEGSTHNNQVPLSLLRVEKVGPKSEMYSSATQYHALKKWQTEQMGVVCASAR
jgi:hypothetical protein